MSFSNFCPRTETSLGDIKYMIDLVADRTDSVLAERVFQDWVNTQKSFWRYSYSNTLLMTYQAADYGFTLTKVAGSTKWKGMGRTVKKGEWDRRLWILAPNFVGVKDKNGYPVLDDNGNQKMKIAGFRSTYVFDLSQTEGDPLPALEYRHFGDDEGLVETLEDQYSLRGISLDYVSPEKMGEMGYSESTKGLCTNGGREVIVRNDVVGIARASTLIHELAHSILHFKEDAGALLYQHTISIAEIEAEAITSVVLGVCGFEWQKSAYYLAAFGGDSSKVKASMDRIAKTAKEILKNILPNAGEDFDQ
jgi:hypothetical protein